MNTVEQKIKTFIADYISQKSNDFQNTFPHENEQFHIIGGLKSEIDKHKKPLILQGRLPEIVEYVTFELDDFLNLNQNTLYKDSTGRIDLFKFVQKPFLQQELMSKGLPVNLEGKIQIIENKPDFDEFQTPDGLIKNLSDYETQSIRNMFLEKYRY